MKPLYDAAGQPRAFVQDGFIFSHEGEPVGCVQTPYVYRLTGAFVGVLHQDMVVDNHAAPPGPQSPPVSPGRLPPPNLPVPRGPFDYGLPDAIGGLFE